MTERRISNSWLISGVSACAMSLLGSAPLVAKSLKAVRAQDTSPWLTHPAAQRADAGKRPVALQFRRELVLGVRPRHFPVRVSADNRYILFVNGQRVAAGPSRGDLDHWTAQQVDLAPFLRAGANVVAAEVWNDATLAPRAQISNRTGFHFESNAPFKSAQGWQVRVDPARTVEAGMPQLIRQVGGTYYVAGAPEIHDGALQSDDWASLHTTAQGWTSVVPIAASQSAPWHLVNDPLPQMAFSATPAGKLVRASGIDARGFPDHELVVPAHSDVSLLVDAGKVEAAYPQLEVGAGAGAVVTITYGEALYDAAKKRLSDRASIANGQVLGLEDTFKASGKVKQSFEPFWWRSWRFAELHIRTGDSPLRLVRFSRHLTGYPFETKAYFHSNDETLNRIWQVGWDTLRVDAHETFMDTSYWEQMQYIGDTRIEALVADMVSGDRRLSEKALRAFDASRAATTFALPATNKQQAELKGLPQAAWPSAQYQSIPPFGLLWIGALHDYQMRWPASALIRDSLIGTRFTLDWFGRYVAPDGLLDKVPGWNFIDWKPNFEGNVSGGPSKDDNRCVLSLMYLGALRQGADLEAAAGDAGQAALDATRSAQLSRDVQAQCWSAQKGLYADNTSKTIFSQHANILAVLYDVAPKGGRHAIMDAIMVRDGGVSAPAGITDTTFYFAYYVARALDHAGLADRYPEMLQSWRKLLDQHFTTWPESPDPSRSDSHAWSAHPTADLLRLVAGIQSAAPGFASVRITPHLGALTSLDAAAAHPNGLISVKYRRKDTALNATIMLPTGLSGQFEWRGASRALHPGLNQITAQAIADHQP